MSFNTPMVCQVTSRVFHPTNPQIAQLKGLPPGHTGFTPVFCFFNLAPVNRLKRYDIAHDEDDWFVMAEWLFR